MHLFSCLFHAEYLNFSEKTPAESGGAGTGPTILTAAKSGEK